MQVDGDCIGKGAVWRIGLGVFAARVVALLRAVDDNSKVNINVNGNIINVNAKGASGQRRRR